MKKASRMQERVVLHRLPCACAILSALQRERGPIRSTYTGKITICDSSSPHRMHVHPRSPEIPASVLPTDDGLHTKWKAVLQEDLTGYLPSKILTNPPKNEDERTDLADSLEGHAGVQCGNLPPQLRRLCRWPASLGWTAHHPEP